MVGRPQPSSLSAVQNGADGTRSSERRCGPVLNRRPRSTGRSYVHGKRDHAGMGNVRSCAGPATASRPMHNLSLRTTLCQRSRRGRRAAPPAHSVWPVRPPLSARSRSPSCRVTSRYRNGDNPASAQLSPELCFATFSITRTNSTGRSHSGLATSAPRPSHVATFRSPALMVRHSVGDALRP